MKCAKYAYARASTKLELRRRQRSHALFLRSLLSKVITGSLNFRLVISICCAIYRIKCVCHKKNCHLNFIVVMAETNVSGNHCDRVDANFVNFMRYIFNLLWGNSFSKTELTPGRGLYQDNDYSSQAQPQNFESRELAWICREEFGTLFEYCQWRIWWRGLHPLLPLFWVKKKKLQKPRRRRKIGRQVKHLPPPPQPSP